MERITSRTNPLLTHIRRLAASGSYRRQCGEYLGDSPKLLQEALLWKAELVCVVHTGAAELPPLPADVRVVEVPADIMTSVSPMDPGNVGTVLRTLDAFDADGLFLLPGCADVYSPKTMRASMGAVFRRPVWTCMGQELHTLLRRSGIPLYGAALRADTMDARAVELSRAAVAIGSEGRGLTEELLALCDGTVRIPMSPRCESLNAAVAASVLLWEAYRGEEMDACQH